MLVLFLEMGESPNIHDKGNLAEIPELKALKFKSEVLEGNRDGSGNSAEIPVLKAFKF